MKLKIIIIASLMYCMSNVAIETKPTYLEMANKEIDKMAKEFKKRFQLISNTPIDIYETCEANHIWHRHIRIDHSNHLKPLCDVNAVIAKHHTLASAILASCADLNLARIVWAEHNHNGTPFMMPYYRRHDNTLICLNNRVNAILKDYATQTPLTLEAAKILDDARAATKKAAAKNEEAAHAMKIKQEQEEQAKKKTETADAVLNSATAAVYAGIPANAAKPTEQSKVCCFQ